MKQIKLILFALVALLATSCTESFKRELKSLKSDYGGGLYRRVEVYDYSGNILRTFEGRFDVQETQSDYIYFDDANGRRVIVHGGIIINEEITK